MNDTTASITSYFSAVKLAQCAAGHEVRVKTPGPVMNIGTGENTAVWPGDIIRVISRVGSRRKCRVTYSHGEYVSSFVALIPKRWLRFLGRNPRS